MTFILFAVTIFVSSNIDGLLVLMALFCAASFHRQSIVLGQFVGSTLLILVGVACSRVALFVPSAWIGLIGVVPLGMGIMKLREAPTNDASAPCDEQVASSRKLNPSGVLSVTLITVSNGGDNLSVYIPVFAARALASVLEMAVVFWVMTGIWCCLAFYFSNHKYIGQPIRRYGQQLLPWVMVGLGLYILSGALRTLL